MLCLVEETRFFSTIPEHRILVALLGHEGIFVHILMCQKLIRFVIVNKGSVMCLY